MANVALILSLLLIALVSVVVFATYCFSTSLFDVEVLPQIVFTVALSAFLGAILITYFKRSETSRKTAA